MHNLSDWCGLFGSAVARWLLENSHEFSPSHELSPAAQFSMLSCR
jgi:hypothetical protein